VGTGAVEENVIESFNGIIQKGLGVFAAERRSQCRALEWGEKRGILCFPSGERALKGGGECLPGLRREISAAPHLTLVHDDGLIGNRSGGVGLYIEEKRKVIGIQCGARKYAKCRHETGRIGENQIKSGRGMGGIGGIMSGHEGAVDCIE
jgi:hypothetical protein